MQKKKKKDGLKDLTSGKRLTHANYFKNIPGKE